MLCFGAAGKMHKPVGAWSKARVSGGLNNRERDMCGIAVAIDWLDAEVAVQHLLKGISHRGDVTDPIVLLRKDTAMGTRRLRIVDAEHAVQPQISFNSRLAVSFNGEIYNHIELRQELADLGIEFKTKSDTEVLAECPASVGVSSSRATSRHVCLRRRRSGQRGVSRSSRSVRRQASLYNSIRQQISFLLRNAAVAANSAGR